jgi:hypothetical protein
VNQTMFTALLALAWFGAVNLALSAFVAGVVPWLPVMSRDGLSRGRPPSGSTLPSGLLLALKLLPGAGAIGFAVVLFLPAHWFFEPRGVEESAGYTVTTLAFVGVVSIALAIRRGVDDLRATRALEWGWQMRAVGPRRLDGVHVPVYTLPDLSPVISLSGFRHPRVFLGRPVVDAFSNDELAVSLAHEQAHHEVRDNLKRIFVACSPDLLGLWRSGLALERRWRAAIEFEADARAVAGSEERAVSLASALVKVAKLAPAAGSSGGSRLYDGTLLRARVNRLLSPTMLGPSERAFQPAWSMPLAGGAILLVLLAAASHWPAVHSVTEALIRLLP